MSERDGLGEEGWRLMAGCEVAALDWRLTGAIRTLDERSIIEELGSLGQGRLACHGHAFPPPPKLDNSFTDKSSPKFTLP